MKVVLCGPPHSGKSCLRYGLKEAIKAIPGSPYPYFMTACPDGEGSWFQETVSEDYKLAKELKEDYKGKFTDEEADKFAKWVKNCQEPFTFIDIGGVIDSKNEHICAHATHAILLAGDLNHLMEWRNFCNKLKLQIIAEIHSDYNGVADKSLVFGDDGIYRGSIHYLERGDLSVKSRPTVMELSSILVNLINTKEN